MENEIGPFLDAEGRKWADPHHLVPWLKLGDRPYTSRQAREAELRLSRAREHRLNLPPDMLECFIVGKMHLLWAGSKAATQEQFRKAFPQANRNEIWRLSGLARELSLLQKHQEKIRKEGEAQRERARIARGSSERERLRYTPEAIEERAQRDVQEFAAFVERRPALLENMNAWLRLADKRRRTTANLSSWVGLLREVTSSSSGNLALEFEHDARQALTKAMPAITAKILSAEGWTVRHLSDSGSAYIERDGVEIRISNHLLPGTDERTYRVGLRGTRWEDEVIVRPSDTPAGVVQKIEDMASLYRD